MSERDIEAGRRQLALELLALPSWQNVDWSVVEQMPAYSHMASMLLEARKLLLAASAGGDAQPVSKEPT